MDTVGEVGWASPKACVPSPSGMDPAGANRSASAQPGDFANGIGSFKRRKKQDNRLADVSA